MKLEERWEKYARHAKQKHEETERKKQDEEKVKEKNMLRREKLFKILQKKEEGVNGHFKCTKYTFIEDII